MSFGGHVNDMVNRIKQNSALINARRNKFKGGNDYLKVKTSKTEYDFPEISEKDLKIIKLEIEEKAKLERNKQFINILIIILVVLFLFIFFIFF